jgi:ABC-type multidrug transport system fused ATPase/permease subunit
LQFIAQSGLPYRLFHEATSSTVFKQGLDSDLHYYLGMYLGISVVVVVLGALRYLLVFQGSIAASKKLFGDFTYALLHAPIRWLDTVPLGRILNRSTSDFGVIDSEMGPAIATILNYSLRVIGMVVAG